MPSGITDIFVKQNQRPCLVPCATAICIMLKFLIIETLNFFFFEKLSQRKNRADGEKGDGGKLKIKQARVRGLPSCL